MTTMNNSFPRHALRALVTPLMALALLPGCVGEKPEGLAPSQTASVTVKMDFFHRPLPDIPLPNDLATRADETSATGRRLNASMLAPTQLEARVRELIDRLDGWGVYQHISIPFTGPLDIQTIIDAHHGDDYNLTNDLVYLVNVDRDSKNFGKATHLDVGNGNYPVVLENLDAYWKNDPRGKTLSLLYEDTDEDVNGNGVLDPGEDANRNGRLDAGEDLDGDGALDLPEDTDADGVLDKPNYRPGMNPAADDLAGRADALMTFFERETNTLIVKPMVPLDERTTYAVVVTRRLLDEDKKPVGSPFPWINHVGQTAALKALPEVMKRQGVDLDEIAFAFSFTTQTVASNWVPVREGLYGYGVQKHLAEEFPARLASLEPVRDLDFFEGDKNPYIMSTEDWIDPLKLVGSQFLGVSSGTREFDIAFEGQQFIDYHVIGSVDSPQLFERTDAQGNPLGFNDQSWPEDLDRVPAQARSEKLYFWLTVPRKEISARGKGLPAPVIVLGHGYTSNRFEALVFSGYLARHGFAVLAIDNVSHGLVLNEDEERLARLLLGSFGIEPFFDAMLKGRAADLNNDGALDSGADFWTSYLFHTRDVVRQSVLDYVQLIRVLRTFDGVQRWDFDVDGDGVKELAGDFDADGQVDVGLKSRFFATGGSLGGFMSSLLGAVEPHIVAVAPISGGGGISDLGIRSVQGGVRQAFILSSMGPLYTATLDAATGKTLIEAIVADLNDDVTEPIGEVDGLSPGDTIVGVNLANNERACGYISTEGLSRIGLPSDLRDPHRLEFYKGNALVTGSTECEVVEGLTPFHTLESFEREFEFQGELYTPGTPLRALVEGLGLRRANPELRRFQPISQLVLDPADPAVYARHFTREPLVYPNMNESTYTHALIVTTLGDMNVPASGGVTIGRAAGFIDYLNKDPRHGKTPNQVMIDNYVNEAVHTYKRHTDKYTGEGVHIDVENFSQGTDIWGDAIPRLDPPLHTWSDRDLAGNDLGGISGAIFPLPIPTGQHGFPFPGQLPDQARKDCEAACEGECSCDEVVTFDTGNFLFNMLGEYFRTNGRVLSPDLCHSRGDCASTLPVPELRR